MNGFNYDIYISYAPSDNVSAKEGQKGWVDNFKYFLERIFKQVIGEDPVFLHYANKEKPTAEQLSNVGLIISIVSPDYVKKSSCIDDIVFFNEGLQKKGLDTQEINQRIFKVVKYPVPIEDQPSKLRDLIGHDLYHLNVNTGRSDEIKDFFSAESEGNFWIKMVDLAYDINDTLQIIKENPERKNMLEVGDGKGIYLAETSMDLLLQRNIIKRELQKYGYKVLPDRALPTNVTEMEATIKKDLENCKMSIHLIGSNYGDIPKGADVSIVEIQNKFAAERCHITAVLQKASEDPAFSRLIWLSPELKLLNERQMQFIESLKKEVETVESTEMVQTPLEDFKSIIRRELTIDLRVNENVAFSPDSSRRAVPAKVYLIYDKIDRKAVEPIIEHIRGRDFDIMTPAFEGNLIEIQKHHVDNLKNFDIAIVYQGFVSEQWVRMKILDLMKAPGYGRKKPIAAKALIAGKGAKNYNFAESFDVELIDNTQAFSKDSLDAVLNELER